MAYEGVRKNERDVAWGVDRSPKGVYEAEYRDVSRHLTVEPTVPARYGSTPPVRPFEVDLVRIPPGRKLCPVHGHSVEWEYYIVLSGHGQMLQSPGEPSIPMEAGDHVLQPPGWEHTVENDGTEDLFYYVIASNSPDEVCWYPNSGTFGAVGHHFRMVNLDYFDGEE